MSYEYTEEEEEEAYYRFIQDKLEQEERAKRQAAAAPAPAREKIVSLGISSHANPSPRDAEIAKRYEKNEKFAKYRSQMEDDQRRVIEETRKPFVRKTYDDEPVEKFAIGKYSDAESQKREKREAQQSYMRQLQADQLGKPVEVDRKAFVQSAGRSVPPARTTDGYLNIGRDEEYDKIAKRRAAIEVQIRNNEAIQAKLYEDTGSPRKKKEPLYDLNRGNDQRSFENADYHFIGEREGDAKAKKQQNANAYMQQLNAGKSYEDVYFVAKIVLDRYNEGGAVPYKTNYRPDEPENGPSRYYQQPEDDDDRDVGGLNIGGVSLRGKNNESKQAQQARYRQQLDQQRLNDMEANRRTQQRMAQRELR